MTFVRQIANKHLLLTIYTIVFILLISGVYVISGFEYFKELSFYFVSFLTFYFLIYFLNNKFNFFRSDYSLLDKVKGLLKLEYLFYASICGILIHMLMLQSIPSWDAYKAMKLSEVVFIRRDITDLMPSWVNYLMAWNLKAMIPFTLAALYWQNKKRLYWIFFIVATLYAFAMMQKSFILLILLPLGVFALYRRDWMYVLKVGLTSVSIVFTLSYIQNVDLRGGVNDIVLDYEKEKMPDGLFAKLAYGLRNRVVIVPGKIVTKWFDHIPEDKPFLKGNGYKIYSKLSGGKYHNYARELYPYVYVENAKHGLVGSVNVASFMRGYSNFGDIGLVISALILALVLVFTETLFSNDILFKLAFNAFPVLMLSSTSLETNLMSGGWMLIMLLYTLYKPKLNAAVSEKN